MASEALTENRCADISGRRASQPGASAGLRERGKSERQRRIKEAAKAVFSDVGYDAATTREIARRAHVSIGTIFVYAKDKRDLLFLMLNDELDPVADARVARVCPTTSRCSTGSARWRGPGTSISPTI